MDSRHSGRASLACLTCRQRKVKCSGEWPSCKACVRRLEECSYPGVHPNALRTASRNAAEVLPPKSVLKTAVEVFFEFYGEFPFWFLRRHAFLRDLENDTIPRCLLLCILSVVARFVETCYDLYGGTVEASIHFSRLAREELMTMYDEINLLNLQCNLVLCIHELGHGNEHKAWLQLGISSRIAQALRLPFEKSYATDDPLTAETKRRMFWSCFALERLLANGRDRPLLVPHYETTVFLPTTQADFTIGRTGVPVTLGDPPISSNPLQVFLIRIIDILSKIVEWGGGGEGGRHSDPRNPWLEDMPFSQLQKQLASWNDMLPPYMVYSKENMASHAAAGEGRVFGLMHLFYLNAGCRLYRKYLPCIPPPFYDPAEGPSDGPLLIPGPECPGWWAESTKAGIQFANAITALFQQLEENAFTPWATPLPGQALMASTTFHVFCYHGKWTSCQEYIGEPAKKMLICNLRFLFKMQESWPVAAFWIKSLRLLYERVSLSQQAMFAPSSTNEPPLLSIKEAILHFDRSDREKEGLPAYLPLKGHDLFDLLDEEAPQ